jgi:hypothetical protein
MPQWRHRVVTARDVRLAAEAAQTGALVKAVAPPASPPKADAYFEKVIGYIPTEIVSAYAVGAAWIAASRHAQGVVPWAWFILLLLGSFALAAIGTRGEKQPVAWFQAIIAFVSFAVWVFALGGPFAQTFGWYEPLLGVLVTIAWSVIVVPVLDWIFMR